MMRAASAIREQLQKVVVTCGICGHTEWAPARFCVTAGRFTNVDAINLPRWPKTSCWPRRCDCVVTAVIDGREYPLRVISRD